MNIILLFVSTNFVSSLDSQPPPPFMPRKPFLARTLGLVSSLLIASNTKGAAGLTVPSSSAETVSLSVATASPPPIAQVAYKPFSLYMEDVGVRVPVAAWFPVQPTGLGASPSTTAATESPASFSVAYQETTDLFAKYSHRISIQRICLLLTGLDVVPKFVARDFELSPSLGGTVVSGDNLSLPQQGPVVLLAHGYLGSRFDLSHLAEELAAEGFTCIAPEYPESLAASFQPLEGLDRARINNKLLEALQANWGIQPSPARRFGIIGHSLGCGTAMQTGDETWARVCIAGFPRTERPGNVLFVSSMNDGAVSLARFGGKSSIPRDFVILDEKDVLEAVATRSRKLPGRSFLVLDRPDAPNHISFLSEGVNNAMIDLLSPLLPVARALDLPVLDFDRYQQSRDSVATARVVHPIIIEYLKQQMMTA